MGDGVGERVEGYEEVVGGEVVGEGMGDGVGERVEGYEE